MDKFMIHEALAAIWVIVDELNGYLTEQEPWVLAKDESQAERLAAVLYNRSRWSSRLGRAALPGDARSPASCCGRRLARSTASES